MPSTPGRTSERRIWAARGGDGERLLVLLHGMGANASVWERLLSIVERSWSGRWLAPDLRGHGRSLREGPYGIGAHAADVAALIEAEAPGPVTLVGHSFGGAVAALVATGWFGPRVSGVAAFGVKIEWTEPEIEKARSLAERPAPAFATREEATERYLRISGLAGLADQSSATAAAGVIAVDGRFQVAMDPRAYGAVGPSIAGLLRLAAVPLRLAAGERDPVVTLEQMQRIDPAAQLFAGVGHNAHWEAPDGVWQFIVGGMR
ncbi:MAG TPA: alpha/beta hydrolase [Methylomirabilota bacterium]|nr:alpha/beta hydrolase [Methylomirabilota bacterium]